MDDLTRRFEASRAHLRGVAYRMLGSLSDADDAVQEAWLRLRRSDAAAIDNLPGWLTTVVARICLDVLRTRGTRAEDPFGMQAPDPLVSREDDSDPAREAVLADSVGRALLVILETLPPAERLAYVLHDMFDLPFDDIAPILERSPGATRQLASRARRRIRGADPVAEPDRTRQRRIVDAYLAASRDGDLAGLLAVLDPDIILRAERGEDGAGPRTLRGADQVARGALAYRARRADLTARPVRVDGNPGVVAFSPDGQPQAVLGFTIVGDRITEIVIYTDPARLLRLDLATLALQAQ